MSGSFGVVVARLGRAGRRSRRGRGYPDRDESTRSINATSVTQVDQPGNAGERYVAEGQCGQGQAAVEQQLWPILAEYERAHRAR